jgi:hypothetical protein
MKVHSAIRLTKISARLATAIMVLACSFYSVGQAPTTKSKGNPPTFKITAWEDERAGAQSFLRTMFPEIYLKSKVVWGPDLKSYSFVIMLCERDSPHPIEDYALFSDFLLTKPQFGIVPAWIHINVREHERRWMGLAVLLAAHPEWTASEVRDAMKINGFKYGDWNRSGVKKARRSRKLNRSWNHSSGS